MADYQSKHTGLAVDTAVDKINGITDDKIRMIDNMREAKNCVLAKNNLGNLQKIEMPTVSSSTSGFMFMEKGKIKIGDPIGSTLSMLSSKINSTPIKYAVKGLYDLTSNIKTMSWTSTSSGIKYSTVEVEDFNATIVKDRNVVQYRLEFKFPSKSQSLSGDFSNICIAKLKTDTSKFATLGLVRNNLIPSTPCVLTTIGTGPLMHGYISEYGNIYLSGVGGTAAKLTMGDRIVLGGTYISKG